eukprot:GHUV01007593.1.p1 GENE.GHUV01007593.1~~GHUV01007593.1.p1  ORF type:complete len:742 (+),score=153.34 GHUV01007593.1:233-2458(+)
MQSIRSMQRRRTLNKFQSTVGTRKGRRGRNLALRPDEPAAVHELMAEDATPNLRVWQMYEEAEEFEDSLMSFKELLVGFEAATDEFLQRLEPILRAPLPRVWDAVEGGLAEPTRATISHAHQHTVGGDVSIAGLEEARSYFHNQIRGHVIRPLDQWREALDVVENDRLPALKRLRGHVVKQSRAVGRYSSRYQRHLEESGATSGAIIPVSGGVHKQGGVKGLFGACTRPRANTPSRMTRSDRSGRDAHSTDSDSEADSDVARMVASEDVGMRLNYKHRKLDAARGDYFEAERVVAEQLEGLCRDGAWLKSYMVAALLLGKEAMQMSVVSLGNTKQPLPGFTARYGGRVEHGILRDNVDLVAMMPPDLKISRPSGMAGSGFGGSDSTSLLPESGLHAHKATATPMELSARPDMHALEWVRPTPTGASAVPLEAVQRAGLGLPEQGSGESGVYRPGSSQRYIEYDSGVARAPTGHRPALGGRMDEGVSRDRDYYQGDESARLAGATPDMTDRGRVWGSPGVSPAGGSAGYREGVTGGSGFRPSERQIPEDDREGLRQHGRGVMGTITDAVEGAAAGIAHAVGLGGHAGARDTSERVPGPGFQQAQSPSDVGYIDRAGMRDQGLGAGGAVREDLSPEVCARKEFTQVEDRPVVRERVTKYLEHRPVEKQYETAMKFVGERSMPSRHETQSDTTRVISATPASQEPEIRHRKEYTELEDRPVVKERVSKILEHRPVAKQYETQLK